MAREFAAHYLRARIGILGESCHRVNCLCRKLTLPTVSEVSNGASKDDCNDPEPSVTVLRTGHRNRLNPPFKLRQRRASTFSDWTPATDGKDRAPRPSAVVEGRREDDPTPDAPLPPSPAGRSTSASPVNHQRQPSSTRDAGLALCHATHAPTTPRSVPCRTVGNIYRDQRKHRSSVCNALIPKCFFPRPGYCL